MRVESLHRIRIVNSDSKCFLLASLHPRSLRKIWITLYCRFEIIYELIFRPVNHQQNLVTQSHYRMFLFFVFLEVNTIDEPWQPPPAHRYYQHSGLASNITAFILELTWILIRVLRFRINFFEPITDSDLQVLGFWKKIYPQRMELWMWRMWTMENSLKLMLIILEQLYRIA